MEQHRKTLHAFSTLFLILAAVSLVTLIIPFAQGEFTVEHTMSQITTPDVSEGLVRGSIIGVLAFAALSILALLYMGVTGLRQYNGKPTGTAHIKIAKVCLVFLFISLFAMVFSLVNNPNRGWDDWVGLCTSLGSVLIAFMYIKAAKALKAG